MHAHALGTTNAYSGLQKLKAEDPTNVVTTGVVEMFYTAKIRHQIRSQIRSSVNIAISLTYFDQHTQYTRVICVRVRTCVRVCVCACAPVRVHVNASAQFATERDASVAPVCVTVSDRLASGALVCSQAEPPRQQLVRVRSVGVYRRARAHTHTHARHTHADASLGAGFLRACKSTPY